MSFWRLPYIVNRASQIAYITFAAHQRFPMLVQLSLCATRITSRDGIPLGDAFTCTRYSGIRTINLDPGMIDVDALMQLIVAIQSPRTETLRGVVADNVEDVSALAVFVRQRETLEELDLRSAHVRFAPSPIRLDTLGALRVLALDAHALQQLRAPLPALERLVLSFAPYSTHMRRTRRQRVFLTVDRIRRLDAPCLREIEIWDEVRLAQIHDWKTAAFMLRGLLPAGVDVAVNLSLEWDDLLWCRLRLAAQKAFRGLYDTY